MADRFSKRKEIEPGDLVFHLLYGKEWIAVFIREMTLEKNSNIKDISSNREMMLVSMLPGLRYEKFFASATL